MKERYKEIIDLYSKQKKNDRDEYNLTLDKPFNLKMVNQNDGSIFYNETPEVPTRIDLLNSEKSINEESIEKLNPDNIDIKSFWRYAVEKFPLFSMSSYPFCKNEDDVNKAT